MSSNNIERRTSQTSNANTSELISSGAVAIQNNIGRQDPTRLRYRVARNASLGNNVRGRYTWGNPHFASVGQPVPLAFNNDRLFDVQNIYNLIRPVEFDFNDESAASISLLEKITNTGTGSDIIDYCIRNKFDTTNDWIDFLHADKNERRFPNSTLRTLGQIINSITDKFDPSNVGAGNSPINEVLKRYNMYQEWKSKILTILETADTSGMLTEFVTRGLTIPAKDDVYKRPIEAIPCFDWPDLKTNTPEFYVDLRLTKDEQVFANNKVLKALKLEFIDEFADVPEEPTNTNRRPRGNNAESAIHTAYVEAIHKEENFFIGYFVLSWPQKDVVLEIEQRLDSMVKNILNGAVSHHILNEHVKPGENLQQAKGIEILRSMEKLYTDVSENDLMQILKTLTTWRIPEIGKSPQKSINIWKQMYAILKKFNKIDDRVAVQHLVTALDSSYDLKTQMMSTNPFNPVSKMVKDSLSVHEFLDHLTREHEEHKKKNTHIGQRQNNAKRKTANATTKQNGSYDKKKSKPTGMQSKAKVDNPSKNPTRNGKYGEKDKFKFDEPKLNEEASKDQCGYCGKTNHRAERCFLITPGAIPANWYCQICKSYFDPKGNGHSDCRKNTANCVTTKSSDHPEYENQSDSEAMPQSDDDQ